MKRAAIVLVVLRLVAISVVVFVPRVTRAYQLARARARWDRCGMQSYTWTISGGGFLVGGGPVEIGGPGRSVRLGHARGPGGPRSGLRSYPRTVPELFDRIADATDTPSPTTSDAGSPTRSRSTPRGTRRTTSSGSRC